MEKFLLLFVLSLFIFLRSVYSQDIFINEFLIEPEQKIELYNNSDSVIDLSGWYLDDSGGTTYFTIPPNSLIYPQQCLVFADNFYLNKSSADTVRLFNNSNPPFATEAILIDSYNYEKSPGENISFQRSPNANNNWISTAQSLGLNNFDQSTCLFSPSPTSYIPSPTANPSPASYNPSPTSNIPSPTLQPSNPSASSGQAFQPSSIFLSEAMPNPDQKNEWVELYNNNSFEVTLTNWFIDDQENSGSSPKKFSATLSAHGLAIIEMKSAIFNNDTDSVRLLSSTQQEVDSVEYIDAPKDQSFSRQGYNQEAVWCYGSPSPNQTNNACLAVENTTTSTQTKTSSAKNNTSPTVTTTTKNQTKNLNNQQDSNQPPADLVINLTTFSLKKQVLGQQTSPATNPKPQLYNQKVKKMLFFNFSAWLIFNFSSGFFLLYNKFYDPKKAIVSLV
jgi:hypothetical protein